MTPPTYYTVITGKRACLVKYAQAPEYSVKLFSGAYDDPAEASQEFKIAVPGTHSYLAEKAFERKVSELANLYRQDLARLADWNIGRTIRI